MSKLIVANWKANPDSLAKAVSLAKKIESGIRASKRAEVVIAPPYPYISNLKSQNSKLKLGAQDAFWQNSGPYTGEVGPAMLKSLGVEYVILGHSERRRLCGETDEMINKKVFACLKAGLKVVLCVGEPDREARSRKQEASNAKDYVKKQLPNDLKDILNSRFQILDSRLIIVYEPVWAISTAKNAKADKPEDALEMIKFIKSALQATSYRLRPRVLYGGSVDSHNARKFLQYKEIDGALVGAASLKADEFIKIIKSN